MTTVLSRPGLFPGTFARLSAVCAIAMLVPTLHADTVDLLAGAKWQYSVNGGATFHDEGPLIQTKDKTPVIARTEFDAGDIASLASIEISDDLIPSLQKTYEVNGVAVPQLLPVMYYNRFPALDPGLLRPGRNVLTARVTVDARRRDVTFRPSIRLVGLHSHDRRIEIGPVLGAVSEGHFTVTCRTNMRVPVRVVRIDGAGGDDTIATSAPGVFHRFRLAQPRDGGRRFALVVEGSDVRAEFSAPRFPDPAQGRLRFVVTSDPQSMVKGWAKTAQAVLAAKPDFLVFGGDLIGAGRDDDAWGPEFFDPARSLLAAVPAYTVQGNHEGQASVVEEYFYGANGPEGRARNWVQDFGDVTVIGVDQWIHLDWESGSENVRWFEQALAKADAKYVFVVSHYPGYSSCSHGKLGEDGLPAEREIRRARQVLIPLMQKYRVTAMVCGHDHYYERTELPGGLFQIITGGAGEARDGQTKTARMQNPFSKLHASVSHYSLFEVADGRCVMTALQPDGTVVDRIEFKPRF